MYIINLPSGVSLAAKTLGDVFYQLNRRRGPDEEVLFGNADKMEVISNSGVTYKVVQANNHIGICMPDQEGRPEDIVMRMFREVMPYVVDEHGSPRQPWQMTEAEWGALHSIHEMSYGVIPCLSVAQRAIACHSRAGVRCSIVEFVASEFQAILGYGGNGPAYINGYTNSRHEVQVAYALARGELVPDRVLTDYVNGQAGYGDQTFLPVLLAKPYLRGRISADRLTMLLSLLRGKGSLVQDITEENATHLIRVMSSLQEGATYVDADDALFQAGILGSIPPFSRPIEPGSPVNRLAEEIRTCILEKRMKDRRKWLEEERAAKRLSLRQLAAEEALIAGYPHQEPYSWANKIVNAIERRALDFLIKVLDQSGNESTKKAIHKHLGIKLQGVSAAARRRWVFALCGFVDDEQYNLQEKLLQERCQVRKAAKEEERRRQADSTRLQDTRDLAASRQFNVNGVPMNGAQFIEKIVGEGFIALDRRKRGAVYEHIIRNPQSGSYYKLDRKDGRLAYAQAYLDRQPMAA